MAKKPTKPQPNGSPAAPSPAYFTSLGLENVRCFREKQTLDLSDGKGGPARWTILLGENGTGKTTVLQAVVAMLWSCRRPTVDLGKQSGNSEVGPQQVLVHFDFEFLSHLLSLPRHSNAEGVLEATFAEDMIGGGEARQLGGQILKLWHASGGIAAHAGALTPHASTPRPSLPLCCAFGASRRLESLLREGADSEGPVGTLFSALAPLRDAENWLLQLDYTASKDSHIRARQQQRLAQVRELLIALLPDVTDIRFDPSSGPYPRPRVEFETPYGWVPLRSLGCGYQTLVAWMVDLASRMAERYPDSPDPLAEPAIVLVDEIDLHLHPRWQRELIGHLTKRFPNTQFIVTAHSPLVVQAAEGANLAVLRREGDQVVIDNDVDMIRNWRIDQIYTSELFGLPSARPPQFDELMKRREQLLSKAKLTEADERELAELDRQMGAVPVGETAAEWKTLRLVQESLEALKAKP
jgi:hypothetical protein